MNTVAFFSDLDSTLFGEFPVKISQRLHGAIQFGAILFHIEECRTFDPIHRLGECHQSMDIYEPF
jgi:hypothetical protein